MKKYFILLVLQIVFSGSAFSQFLAVNDNIYNANAAMGGLLYTNPNFPNYFNVLSNDALDGDVNFAFNLITVTQITTTNPGISVDGGGNIFIQNSVPPGTYTLTYQACEIANPTNCDTASVTVEVCFTATPTVTIGQPNCTNPNGSVTLSDLPAGTWTITYKTYFSATTTIIGTGPSATISNLAPEYYYFKVISDSNCISAIVNAMITIPVAWNITYTGVYIDFNNNGVTDAGDTINWTVNIENVANCPLTNVQVVFSDWPVSGGPIPMIPIGANADLTATSILTQEDINNGEASFIIWLSADSPLGQQYDKIFATTGLNIADGIMLNAFLDTNNNGIQDSGESNYSGNYTLGTFHYEINNDGIIHDINTDNGSYYIYETNPVNSYDISFDITSECGAQFVINPSSYSNVTIPVGSGVITYNFPISIVPCRDLSVYVSRRETARPGFPYSHWIVYQNLGNQIESGTITFASDPLVTTTAISASGGTVTPSGFTYNFVNLQPFEYRYFYVIMDTPGSVALGTLLTSNVSITLLTGEDDITNNTDVIIEEVTNSYDPNDISENHGDQILWSTFDPNEYLTYTIRFENTGNADAINISINNVLDAKLDDNSVRMIGASHPYVLDRVNNNLTWNFSGIGLPPSVSGTDVGKGFLTFEVKMHPGFAIGDVVPAQAAIYFDSNPAIITNTWNTEFVSVLGLPNYELEDISIYPNPTSDIINISVKNDSINQIEVIDVAGKVIDVQKINSMEAQLDLSPYSDGIYFAKVKSGNQMKIIKIIKN